jgi:hypothetical protein
MKATIRVTGAEAPPVGTAAFAIRPEKLKVTPYTAGRSRHQRRIRRALGHRLSRRHDRFPRQAEERQGGARRRTLNAQRSVEDPFVYDRKSGSPSPRRRRRAEGLTPWASSDPSVYNRLVIIIPYVWLLLFFLAPFFIVFKISLSTTAIAMPPYTPAFSIRRRLSDSGTRSPALLRQLHWLTTTRSISTPI